MKFVIKQKTGKRFSCSGMLGSFMTVDPGYGGTGYAVWDRHDKTKLEPPIDSGAIVTRDSAKSFTARLESILTPIGMIRAQHSVMEVAIELPQFFEGGKGMVAARGGDLVTLAILAGAIAGRLGSNSCVVTWLSIPDWKGQLDKDDVANRVMKRLPNWKPRTNTTHEMDAVGMGLWMKEEL